MPDKEPAKIVAEKQKELPPSAVKTQQITDKVQVKNNSHIKGVR
ncbi:hypothetical protein [Mucilaginibacter phenanthrenivorans]|nr:hypothetical protein [Mucilaginibacter phenanthrenivorans]